MEKEGGKREEKKQDFLEYVLPITSLYSFFGLHPPRALTEARIIYRQTHPRPVRDTSADVDRLLAVEGLKMPGRQYRSPFSSFTMTTIVIGIVALPAENCRR